VKVSYKPQNIADIPRVVKGKVGEILRKIGTEEQVERVMEALELVELADRDVSALSGVSFKGWL
jgi:ATP-binding cassette subfamily E protein 1